MSGAHIEPAVAFEDSSSRSESMTETIEVWIEDLITHVEEARGSKAFQEWLDVQSRFHDYSYRNTLLITLQCPEATKVAGYRAWQEEFDRHVQEGESAIWIWAPIITTQCPECGNSPNYHEQSDCEYDETPPEEWSEGLVGFRPASVFDVSQTEGEPLPELETAATGDAGDLVTTLEDAASELDVEVRLVDADEWIHGQAEGICKPRQSDESPLVEVRNRANEADLAVTLVHELAHALLHGAISDPLARSEQELEAEAVAYVVGRHYGLDTSNSSFYLAAWAGDDPEAIRERLGRISRTAQQLIDVVDSKTA
ncbi:ArdC-like ssDNA-binding domain-containing protein [Halobacterium salinarum]|uniref:ImmA/IrrE family metallo-endopeptidase n=1 Tax=Halobacterium salinarum TaxID=2242 RepID=UPI0025552668|nr:ImmA/IrrE family metallo-endopeptidase [Halobacterium salinarum]MDL0118788.1 ArdC-like ssDNA-binding domain-containing protein [Halobacterium salinarum]MDL0119725.1 ArdC-like ssDNA-binding domain-containing protein [Halobacterium salinarum]